MESARLSVSHRYTSQEQTALEGIRLPVKLYAEIMAFAEVEGEA